ncbi:hypothetical protein BU16DRAFT_561642 [Lophium mytilinum]|uniref:Uncharacterized protein n=1 Tax=Lophium mytilinum TaxID=390894 RepID=A0A6A6QSH1_9PEZI|nr:hypothetical protein BU16DRAFT_561642 [Lophium mytilinum]
MTAEIVQQDHSYLSNNDDFTRLMNIRNDKKVSTKDAPKPAVGFKTHFAESFVLTISRGPKIDLSQPENLSASSTDTQLPSYHNPLRLRYILHARLSASARHLASTNREAEEMSDYHKMSEKAKDGARREIWNFVRPKPGKIPRLSEEALIFYRAVDGYARKKHRWCEHDEQTFLFNRHRLTQHCLIPPGITEPKEIQRYLGPKGSLTKAEWEKLKDFVHKCEKLA